MSLCCWGFVARAKLRGTGPPCGRIWLCERKARLAYFKEIAKFLLIHLAGAVQVKSPEDVLAQMLPLCVKGNDLGVCGNESARLLTW
eukprot:6655641-Prymnesium_polylepis.1